MNKIPEKINNARIRQDTQLGDTEARKPFI